jgi:exopolysaccharide production protein ExoZ
MKNKIESLQICRGIAAIYVVLYHTMIITIEKGIAMSPELNWISTHGFLGVNFFFVLSGYIILQAHNNDLSQPKKAKHIY